MTGLTEMFRRKRPYLVTIARQLVCDEVPTFATGGTAVLVLTIGTL